MDECKVCANADNEYCFACDNGNQFKPMTNADLIRSLSDEELAEFLVSTDGDFPPNCEDVPIRKLEAYWLDWLKEEAEGGGI